MLAPFTSAPDEHRLAAESREAGYRDGLEGAIHGFLAVARARLELLATRRFPEPIHPSDGELRRRLQEADSVLANPDRPLEMTSVRLRRRLGLGALFGLLALLLIAGPVAWSPPAWAAYVAAATLATVFLGDVAAQIRTGLARFQTRQIQRALARRAAVRERRRQWVEEHFAVLDAEYQLALARARVATAGPAQTR